jgi:ribosome-associated protein
VADGDLVTPGGLRVAGASLDWRFTRSSGAGGQHVNTSDSKAVRRQDRDDG